MEMRRYIVLLLITGIVWAQTDFDTLILKSGTAYFGEYSKLEEEIVYFKPQNAFAFQPIGISRVKFWLTGTISINKIKILQLKDGQFIIGDILTYEEFQKELIIIEDGEKSLTLEVNQKDSLEVNQKKITVNEKSIVVLKTVSGKEYKGKYLKTEGGKVFFIPEGASSPTQVPIESIKEIITETGKKISLLSTLIMKDGTVIKGSLTMISIDAIRFLKENETTLVDIQKDDIKSLTGYDGEIDLNNIDVKSLPDFDTLNGLAFEEYQKLSTKEKAIYDANLYNVNKWALYMPMSIMFFGGFAGLYYILLGGEFWESPIFSGGSSAASFYITYLVFNNNEKFNFPKSILTDSEKEIYKQAYSKKLRQRKFKYIVGSTIVIVAVAGAPFRMNFSSSDFGYITDGYNP